MQINPKYRVAYRPPDFDGHQKMYPFTERNEIDSDTAWIVQFEVGDHCIAVRRAILPFAQWDPLQSLSIRHVLPDNLVRLIISGNYSIA